MIQNPFNVFEPQNWAAPIIISSPHSGVAFPEDERDLYHAEFVSHPCDTDWYVHELYDFARELNVALISANYSRFVIDLNRAVNDQPLYSDGRFTTGLFPSHTFTGREIYRAPINQRIKNDRRRKIYEPYHMKIEELVEKAIGKWGVALLFEAHSIKSHVQSIREERFPHFIIGTADGRSCPKIISDTLITHLSSLAGANIALNDPFKGGFITRKYGDRNSNRWSVQLEMSQDMYLDESNDQPNLGFKPLSQVLRQAIEGLMDVMNDAAKR